MKFSLFTLLSIALLSVILFFNHFGLVERLSILVFWIIFLNLLIYLLEIIKEKIDKKK